MKGRLAQASLRTSAVLFGRLLTQAVTLVIVTRLLAPGDYGVYLAASSMAVLLGLIPNLGAGYVLMARAPSDPTAAGDVWRYAWPLSLVLGTSLTLAFPFAAREVTGASISLSSLLIMGATEVMLTPVTSLLSFMLQASHRVATGQLLQWVPFLLRMVGAIGCFVVSTTRPLATLIVVQFAATLCGVGISILLARRFVALGGRPRRPRFYEWKAGSSYAAMHVVAANPAEVDKILAPLLLQEQAAGIYGASSRVMNAIVLPVVGMLLASQPRLFEHALHPSAQGSRLIHRLGYLAFGWGALSAAGMSIGAPMLVRLMGSPYKGLAELMPWIAAAAPFVSLRLAAGTVLVALGRPLQRLSFELIGIGLLGVALWTGSRLAGTEGMAGGLIVAEACMAATGWFLVTRVEQSLTSSRSGVAA